MKMFDSQHIETFLKEVIKNGFVGHKVDEFQIKVELIEYSTRATHNDIKMTYVLEKKVLQELEDEG